MKYFIKLDDEIRGPFSVDHIRQRISERSYQSTDLGRAEGSEDWGTLGELTEFAEAFAPQAPAGNLMAVASLLFSLSSALMFFPAMLWSEPPLYLSYWLTGLCGILFGYLAIRKIGHSSHDIKGYRVARASVWLSFFMVVIVPLILIYSSLTSRDFSEKGGQVQAINNCKQIIISLRLYASDHDGKYPDSIVPNPHSSNDAFRLLFKEGVLDTEKIFGANKTPYHPDGNIGEAPNFLEALKPGENHWAMTKGLSDSMDGSIPLVFENPSDANWPPKWNASEANWLQKLNATFTGIKPSRPNFPGYAWSKGKIVIGLNDSSVQVYTLEASNGKNIGLKPHPDGTPVFTALDPKLEILNVAK